MTSVHNGGSPNKKFENLFALFAEKMRKAEIHEEIIDLFKSYYEQLVTSRSDFGFIREKDIQPLQFGDISKQKELSEQDRAVGQNMLGHTVMIKLNGGLGTSMGMPYAKSLLEAKIGYTFLDITLLQASKNSQEVSASIPLVLMNSFNTHKDTINYFHRKNISKDIEPISFVQNMYPKILKDTLEPASWPQDPELEWNPPGHGDLYASLWVSGILEQLINEGKHYAFVSNIDNLGAVVDPAILGYFVRQEFPFLMEVAVRSQADKKGGHLAKLPDGRLILREIAQCPEEEVSHFQDVDRHIYFNTNNIWINLKSLKEYIEQYGLPRLPLIVNPKTLDPRDESSPEVYQLETAMGAAISSFKKSGAIQVERERFIPVKKTNDLMAVRSDCYELGSDFQLRPNSQRRLGPIYIDLDSKYYKKIDQFEERFPFGPPSLIDCESLVVQGDVLFEKNIVCKGKVQIKNKTNEQQRLSSGSIITEEVILE